MMVVDGRDKETDDNHYEWDNNHHHHHNTSHHHDHLDMIAEEQDDDDDDVARFMAAAQGLLGSDMGESGGGGGGAHTTVAHVQRTIENLLLRLSRALTRTKDGADHLVVCMIVSYILAYPFFSFLILIHYFFPLSLSSLSYIILTCFPHSLPPRLPLLLLPSLP